jgi:hypothetical protein
MGVGGSAGSPVHFLHQIFSQVVQHDNGLDSDFWRVLIVNYVNHCRLDQVDDVVV